MSKTNRKVLVALIAILVVTCIGSIYATYTFLTSKSEIGLKTIQFEDNQTYNLTNVPFKHLWWFVQNITAFQWTPKGSTNEILEIRGEFEYSCAIAKPTISDGVWAHLQVWLQINNKSVAAITPWFACSESSIDSWRREAFKIDSILDLRNEKVYTIFVQLGNWSGDYSVPILIRNIQLSLIVSEG